MSDDLISREALKKAFEYLFYNDVDDMERTEKLIDNAPTVSDRYDEGYAQGYIDGHTGADYDG